ncbi:hypothetical protein PAI11_03470 [Patulibacter medicamentivorans]|uniref:Uncharacterized protein n=1 Tax=Patulibacter medicamentivorans TaxID=1097667 RepID=H0E0N9_9ACTN|nr:hypothetical protein PAI11_03470 [Patulibacter medicamentivorans]
MRRGHGGTPSQNYPYVKFSCGLTPTGRAIRSAYMRADMQLIGEAVDPALAGAGW